MKNRNVYLFLCGLALMLTMYNCQRVDEPLPTTPNADLLKGFTDIKMAPADLVNPEAVISTPSALMPAAVSLDFRKGLGGSDGQVPAELQTATDALKGSLSDKEIGLMADLSPEVIKALMSGNALPDDLQKVVDRAESSPNLSVYFRKPVEATVQEIEPTPEVVLEEVETTVPNARTGASSTCRAQAQAAFEDKRDELRDERRQQLDEAKLENKQDIADAKAATAACISSVSYDAEREAALEAANEAIEFILNSNYPNRAKREYLAIVRISLSQALRAINRLEASDRRLCEQVERIAIIAANNAYKANQRAIQANFEAALELARAQKAVFIANCEYQQGQGL